MDAPGKSKTERQCVVDAGTDRRAAAIVRAVIVRAVTGMAREPDMLCVAQGIEDEQTHELALPLGADLGPGHLYARPMSADDFARHIAAMPKLSMLVNVAAAGCPAGDRPQVWSLDARGAGSNGGGCPTW